MLDPSSILLAVSVAVALFWIALSTHRSRRWPASFFLPPPEGAPIESERVAAIVPARNEESTLPATLPSLLDQPALDVIILVDDSSTDRTAEVAEQLAHGDGRLRIVEAGARPPGWSGKVAALAEGIRQIESLKPAPDWLLFTDADIRHHPSSVEALLHHARRNRLDLVSVMARLHAGHFWERLIVPPFVFFFHLLYPFRLVARERSKVAAAAGGCILVRRSKLEAAGGLEEIRDRLIDDVALAHLLKRSGGRLWLGFDGGIESVRPYPRLAQLWKMVSRNAFVQLRFRWDLLAFTILGIFTLFVLPPLLVPVGLWISVSSPTVGGLIATAGVLSCLLESRALLPYVRHHRVPPGFALTLPVASVIYALMTASSAWSSLGSSSSSWRGRTYRRKLATESGDPRRGNGSPESPESPESSES